MASGQETAVTTRYFSLKIGTTPFIIYFKKPFSFSLMSASAISGLSVSKTVLQVLSQQPDIVWLLVIYLVLKVTLTNEDDQW